MPRRFPEAAALSPEELRVGLTAEFEREITEADVFDFARLSGDANPLHVDADYAAATNYAGRIVHGAFQVSMASALIGMHLPGRHVLLGAANAKFPSPLYYPCRVRVAGQVTAWNAANRSGTIRVTVNEAASRTPTADVHLNFTWHVPRGAAKPQAAADVSRIVDTNRRVVLVTGAAGGIGTALVARLASEYTVIAMVRRPGTLAGDVSHTELVADLQDPGWSEALRHHLDGRRLYGIVHAAWPGQPHGSLLQVDGSVVEHQLTFGVMSTIDLARFLFTHTDDDDHATGGRLIVMGSIAGQQKPVLPLASYSLGKAAVEHTVRLLAPELARRQITINVISPSFIAVGMNKQRDDRQQMKEAALVPLGRVCDTDDVEGLVRFLLSREAGFISGQTIGLTGARL